MSMRPEAAERPPLDLGERLAYYGRLVHTALRSELAESPELEQFYGMMAYHFGWVDQHFAAVASRAGKSLRPSLCLLVTEALAGDPAESVAFAAGLEAVHNFSLIHDDIED